MAEFDLVAPDSIAGVLEALERFGADATVLAGGTDLAVQFRSGARSPRVVIWLGKVGELRRVFEEDGRLTVGSTVTHSELAAHGALQGRPVLARAAASVGSPQVRNAGTAGGNIANASPAADLAPALLVLDAEVRLASAGAERRLPLEDFIRGPGLTAARPNEIITGIALGPSSGSGSPGAFFCDFAKVGLRNAVAISVASAAIAATLDGDRFGAVRIACGAVAPTPIRMRGAEALLRGQALTPELLGEVEAAVARECDPITDVRASADYRRRVAAVTVSRLVEAAWGNLGGRH